MKKVNVFVVVVAISIELFLAKYSVGHWTIPNVFMQPVIESLR